MHFKPKQLNNTLSKLYRIAMRLILITFFVLLASITAHSQEGPQYQISIYFGGGSYYISEEQKNAITEFLNGVPHVEQYSITIHSHTDNIGGVEFNNWLSQMRSHSAMEQLLINSIKQEMIEIKDFGLHNPVYDNSTWEGKLKNRRVDIFLWPLAL
jgi:outer membrane protein OmpA-like peptidoglycan-associated protein